MTSLYYDCFAGISGDMNLGALLDLGVDEAILRDGLDRLGLEAYALHIGPDSRGGIFGIRAEVVVEAGSGKPVRRLAAVRELIGRSGLGRRVESFSLRVFERLAAAEARVHGVPIDEVHFHEVGAVDALVDIVGASICLEQLGWPLVTGSAVELGSGFVDCAHGRLPVPAPATQELLRDVPTRRGGVAFEATTPTGAAILVTVAERFDPQASLVARRVGHGIGRREGPLPNLLRVLAADPVPARPEELSLLECNIDDMSPELYPYLLDRLLASGARDAWIAPIVMKKGRPGILVSVLCEGRDEQTMTRLLFAETTTLGVRRNAVSRSVLERTLQSLDTPFGPVPVKVALQPDGSRRVKPEYEACRSIAMERDLPLREVYRELERLLEENDGRRYL
jgi:pyridinium-3,5-bisthiocarboxylic acid mononucleotide nickel chelatase